MAEIDSACNTGTEPPVKQESPSSSEPIAQTTAAPVTEATAGPTQAASQPPASLKPSVPRFVKSLPSLPPASVCIAAHFRFDWYQTQTDVVVNVLVKNVKQQDAEVEFSDNNVSCIYNTMPSENYVVLVSGGRGGTVLPRVDLALVRVI